MTQCIQEGTLRAYADGALAPDEEATVSRHLAHCDLCKGSVAELDLLASEVASLMNDGVPLPDSGAALTRLRATLPKVRAHAPADVSPVAKFTVAAPKRRTTYRPMRLQPFAAGMGLAAAVAALFVMLFALSGLQQTASKPASEFVPKGMVRHMTVSHTFTTTVEGQIGATFVEEVWLTNGKDHLLMHNTYEGPPNGRTLWVEDEVVYIRDLYPYGPKIIRKFPYDARHLELYVPNEISYLVTIPNAKIVGDDVLDGRPVTVIEAIADKVNPTPEVFAGGVLAVTDYKLWVDKETSQVLQREHKSTFLDGSNKGKTQTQTFKVTSNELKAASQFPADLFTFKLPDGATVVEAESPFGPTPTPGTAIDADKPTPTFPTGIGGSIFITRLDTSKQTQEVFPVDPATGKAVPGYEPIIVGAKNDFVGETQLSQNGSRLLVIEARSSVNWPWGGGSSTRGSADVLHLIDVQAWREITTPLSTQQAAYLVAFSDDGKYLALDLRRYKYDPNSIVDELVLVEAATGVILTRRDLDIQPSRMEFSADGSELVVYGQRFGASPGTDKPGPPRVILLDRTTLKTVWEHTLDDITAGYWCETSCEGPYEQKVFVSWDPAVTFSPDRDKLYIVHADDDRLTTIDFAARQVRSVDIAEAKSWLEALLDLTASKAEAKGNINGVEKLTVLSADGEKLYVTGQKLSASSDVEAQRTELQVIEVKTGHKVAILESDLGELRMSSDGKQLFLSGLRNNRQTTDVLDAASFKRITTIEDWRVMPLQKLDGRPILMAVQRVTRPRVGTETLYGLIDLQTFKVTSTWPSSDNESLVARR